LSSDAGVRFGKLDDNIAKGMSPRDFVEKSIKSIFLKERELILSNPMYVPALILRNIIPDAVFWAVWKRKAGEMKKMLTAK
jgi:hypothetical protein